jgi:hypothetical protein
MLGICNLHYQGAKGHIYSTCTGHKYVGNPLTDGENIIYNIHLTISIELSVGSKALPTTFFIADVQENYNILLVRN